MSTPPLSVGITLARRQHRFCGTACTVSESADGASGLGQLAPQGRNEEPRHCCTSHVRVRQPPRTTAPRTEPNGASGCYVRCVAMRCVALRCVALRTSRADTQTRPGGPKRANQAPFAFAP